MKIVIPSSEILKYTSYIALIVVLIINWNSWEKIWSIFPKNSEFWMLFFIFIWTTISDIFPISLKNWIYYNWEKNKFFWRKTFRFWLLQSFKLGEIFTESIWGKLESKLREKTPNSVNFNFRKVGEDNNKRVYLNKLYIQICESTDDTGFWEIHFSFNNENYGLRDLEKDIEFYNNLINHIKETFKIEASSVKLNITINWYYTPTYLIDKCSNGWKDLKLQINNNITLNKTNSSEELIITNSNDLSEATKSMMHYLQLSNKFYV